MSELGYIPGDYWMICDRCGLKYRSSVMNREWNGLWVCPEDFEERHPNDHLGSSREERSVPVARPRVTNVFIDTLTNAERKKQI